MDDIFRKELLRAFSAQTMEEQTTTADAGVYIQPQVWAKNEKNWRPLSDPTFPKYGGPGAKYVKVKDKCKTFPYCSQGALDNPLDFYEPVRKKKKKGKKKKQKLTPLGRRKRKIAKDLVTMGHSVTYINDIIAGNAATDVNDTRKKLIVGDNVMSLENMIAYKDWKGDEDFTDANKAITDGKAYMG